MTIKTTEAYHIAADGHKLHYQIWKPGKDNLDTVLIFVHGLNEHSGRYTNPINYFVDKGYTIYLFDHKGHGKSDGLRSYVDNFDEYLEDLEHFTQFVNQSEKKKKIYMVGHSMGGQILLNYVARYKAPIDGFMTSSANIEMALKVPALKKMAGLWLAKYFPRFGLPNEIDPMWISRDQDVVEKYKQDPLVSKKITLKLASEIMRNQESIMSLAKKITLPGFLMHGGADQICAADGTRKFYDKMGSTHKAIKIYDHFYHEIFNEIGHEVVFQDMENWIKKNRQEKRAS